MTCKHKYEFNYFDMQNSKIHYQCSKCNDYKTIYLKSIAKRMMYRSNYFMNDYASEVSDYVHDLYLNFLEDNSFKHLIYYVQNFNQRTRRRGILFDTYREDLLIPDREIPEEGIDSEDK